MTREPIPIIDICREDYLERHLWKWAQWMRSGESVNGYKHSSSGLSSGGASEHFEDMLEREERRIAVVTNSVIDDLPADQRCALHHSYLHAVYILRDYVGTLARAKVRVRAGLKSKGIWMGE